MKTHYFSGIRLFSALIDACWKERYTSQRLLKDTVAGITVGIIAIPLVMALAIASGVAPQYGYIPPPSRALRSPCAGARILAYRARRPLSW